MRFTVNERNVPFILHGYYRGGINKKLYLFARLTFLLLIKACKFMMLCQLHNTVCTKYLRIFEFFISDDMVSNFAFV